MYLSRIKLSGNKREAMMAQSSPSRIHGTLETSFGGQRRHPLWRIDKLNGEEYILILTDLPEDFTAAADILSDDGTWEQADYSKLLNRVKAGTTWRFRLTANPTISEPAKPTAPGAEHPRGHVKALALNFQQLDWLSRQGEKHGFKLPVPAAVTESTWKVFNKKGQGKRVSILSVTFEGILTVTDEALFLNALVNGIGRGKAYGNGLLTLASVNG